jgi:hypothetical protein
VCVDFVVKGFAENNGILPILKNCRLIKIPSRDNEKDRLEKNTIGKMG